MNEKRPDLPYEKAAEETAKAVGKALDLVDQASPAIADIYNLLIGDRISEAQKRNADKFARETKRIFQERDIKGQRELPEDLAATLLKAAMREPREELQRLFAALAVNAMDPAFIDDVRPEFVETVKKWQPLDLRAMQFAASRRPPKPQFDLQQIEAGLTTVRLNAVAVSVDHLKNLGCLSAPTATSYAISPFGAEIIRAVSEHPEKDGK